MVRMFAFFLSAARRSVFVSLALASAAAACAKAERSREPAVDRDDYGTPIIFAAPAERIVSLNPTSTEILFALGAGPKLVGRSRWDNWPAAARAVPDIGDAIRPSVEQILAVRPTLVVLYASGDNRDAASALEATGIAVVALKIDRIADFTRGVLLLGRLSGTDTAARFMVDSVARSLARVRDAMRHAPRPTVFIHVWDNPLMAIGGGSFMSELVEIAGATNVYANLSAPSAQVSFEDLLRRAPTVILAGPDAAARLSTDPRWRALDAVRAGRVLSYDTSLVARPSVRLGEAARSLAALFHPERAIP